MVMVWHAFLLSFAVLGGLTLAETSGAIAQEPSSSPETVTESEGVTAPDESSSPPQESPTPTPVPDGDEIEPSGSELDLSDIRAFGSTTDSEVYSVEPLDPTEYNALLLSSYQNQAIWANDPLWVGLQLLQFLGQPITGAEQRVSVSVPGEWEPGMTFEFARVIIDDKGWLDDAIAGERYVIWIVPGDSGEFKIQRALRANFCRRPLQEFYSSQNCP
ncbi:MAG: hypothetical protein VKJ64_00740 [Leptolyngbyaceae bacterium]|nr:hypothetical protein [Leptolyngbyaceae bacterium]